MTEYSSAGDGPYAGVRQCLGRAVTPHGFVADDFDGYRRDSGDLWLNVYVHRPSSESLPDEADIEVAVGVASRREQALVYLSTWQAVHGDVARYRPSTPGWPDALCDDFQRVLLPEVVAWRDSRDLFEALLAKRVPPNRGVAGADHATAAWTVAVAAELGPAAESRAVELVNADVWPDDVADHLEWFAERFGMPLVVQRAPHARRVGRWARKQ
ncbi:hypothetical protein [Demequina sp.]|uniref:hypothetical protein n=1 Tax=Demequina sp. TaxID=2050685 RepID=UPI003A8A012C